jgi:hypothetical protein
MDRYRYCGCNCDRYHRYLLPWGGPILLEAAPGSVESIPVSPRRPASDYKTYDWPRSKRPKVLLFSLRSLKNLFFLCQVLRLCTGFCFTCKPCPCSSSAHVMLLNVFLIVPPRSSETSEIADVLLSYGWRAYFLPNGVYCLFCWLRMDSDLYTMHFP